MDRPSLIQILLQEDIDRTIKILITGPKEDKFNESIITLLSRQQDLQKQSLDMMKNMTR